jgi:hypothetical protein
LHEVDEAKIAAQSAEWISDLLEMYHAQHSPQKSPSGIALPPGMRVVPMEGAS